MQQGEHVLVWLPNGPECLVTWFAINYLGAVYVPATDELFTARAGEGAQLNGNPIRCSGTTDLAVFTRGAIQHTAVLPIAGDQITNDIAMTLRTPTREAEDLKIQHGIALRQLADAREMIEVPGIGERGARMLSKQLLSEVIEPRVEELYSLVQAELRRSGFEEQISSGIVLTGGSSQMKGMVELAEEVFHVPVRVGIPDYVGGLSERVRHPGYATGVGLLLAGLEKHELDEAAKIEAASFGQVMERMKSWFKNTF